MVFFETTGDNDFRSIFESVRREEEERAEREQAEKLLSLLGDIETGDPRRPRREHMRVSITDADKADRENEAEAASRATQRKAAVRRVHTLDDLPKEDIFGFVHPAENEEDEGLGPLDVQIIPGRRIGDGAIRYHATMPLYKEYIDAYGEIQMEHVLIGFLVLFLIGVYFGSRAVRNARARSQKQHHPVTAPPVVAVAPPQQPSGLDAISNRLGLLEAQISLLAARR